MPQDARDYTLEKPDPGPGPMAGPPQEINDPSPGGGGGQPGGTDYIWVDPGVLLTRLRSGPVWEALSTYAAQPFNWTTPTDQFYPALWNQDGNADVLALAKALVWCVDPNAPPQYRIDIQQACLAIANNNRHNENVPASLCATAEVGVARNVASFVIAIDYVGWTTQADKDTWRSYLLGMFNEPLVDGGDCMANGRSLEDMARDESNNIGCMARASYAAIFRHLHDDTKLAQVRLWFRGWLGDRSSHIFTDYVENPNGSFTDTWHAGSGVNRVPLLPAGTQFSHSGCLYNQLSGALPEELRRADIIGDDTGWPGVTCTQKAGNIIEDDHVYGALAGAFVTAELFRNYEANAFYNEAYMWENNALKRAVDFVELERTSGPTDYRWFGFNGESVMGTCPNTGLPYTRNGDDWWILWLDDFVYGPRPNKHNFDTCHEGKNMCFTDWTHP